MREPVPQVDPPLRQADLERDIPRAALTRGRLRGVDVGADEADERCREDGAEGVVGRGGVRARGVQG